MQLLGYLFHWGLFGVLCMQVCESNPRLQLVLWFETQCCEDMYYLAFPTDPTRNKLFVYSVFILEVMQTILITRSAFYVFGRGYGNFAYFNHVQLAWFTIHVITGIGKFRSPQLPSNIYSRDICSRFYCANLLRLPNQHSCTIEKGR